MKGFLSLWGVLAQDITSSSEPIGSLEPGCCKHFYISQRLQTP